MKWRIVQTPNGVLVTAKAEAGDDKEQVNLLRVVRKSLAIESGTIEGVNDEITFFRPLKWSDEKTPVRTS